MKKNIKNEKVIRAITIGLATMIAATSTPMTVFADEADPTEGGSDDNNYSSTEDTASETSDEAIGSTADAATSAEVVANDVNTNVTPKDVEVTEDGIIVDKSQVVIDAAGTVANDPQYVDAAGALTTVPVYDKKGNLINGIKTEDESTMVDDIKAAKEELLSFDACMTTIESMMESGKVDTNASGYDFAFKANLEAFKAAVYTYGYDYVQGLNADEVNAMEDEAAKAILLNLIGTRDEITKYAIKDDWNAKKVVAPALEDIKDEKGEKAAADDMDKAVEDGQAIAEAAFGEQKKADDAAGEATELVNETEEKFNGYVEDIEKAKTISAAKNAYNELLDLLGNAETTLAEKQAAYDAAYKAFYGYKQVDPETEEETEVKGLKALYEEKQAALTAAKAAYNAASEKYEKAKSAYIDLDGKHTTKINDLTTYHAALEAAKESLAQAEADLANAKAKADALVDAATAAKEAVIADKAAMLDVVKKIEITEEKVKEDGKTSWNDEDALCLSIIKNYYIPSIAEGELTDIKCETIKGNKTVDNNTYNYIKVTYKVDGAEVVKYLNYKLEKGSKSSIYIFEKRENEIAANNAYMNDPDATLYKEFDELNEGKDDKDKVSVDGYTAGDDKLTEDELQAALADGTVVQIDGVYYQLNDATSTSDAAKGLVSDNSDKDGKRTVIINGEVTAAQEYNLVDTDNDGEEDQIVREYKTDQTTIVYHKNSNLNGDSFTTDNEDAAFDAAIKNVKCGDILIVKDENGKDVEIKVTGKNADEIKAELSAYKDQIVVDKSYAVDTYQIKGTYVPVFTHTVNINKTYDDYNVFGMTFQGKDYAEDENIESAVSSFKSQLANGGYTYSQSKDGIKTTTVDDTDWLGWGHKYYTTTGTSTFTYYKSDLIKKGTADDITVNQDADTAIKEFFGASGMTEDEIQQKWVDYCASQGQFIVGWENWNITFSSWNAFWDSFSNATFYYVDGQAKIESAVFDSEEAANSDYAKKREDSIKKNNTSGLPGDSLCEGTIKDFFGNDFATAQQTTVKGTRTQAAYGYNISFWSKDSETTKKDVVVGKDVYDNSDKLYGYVEQNRNVNTSLFNQSDKEFQKLVKETSDLRDKYTRIEEEAKDAQAAVKEAQEQVETLRKILYLDKEGKDKSGYIKVKTPNGLKVLDIVKDLGINPEDYTLEDLDEKLSIFFSDYPDYEFLGSAEEEFEKAKEELEAAKEKLKELTDQKEDVEKKLADTIRRLTPDDDDDEEDVPGTPGGDTFFVPGSVPGALMAALPTTGVAGVRAPRAGRGVAAVEEAADGDSKVVEAVKPAAKTEKKETKKVATTKIEDNKTPLAAAPVEETNNMNWWWLLLVALLGATGYEMYKKHQQKKAEAEAVSESINKEEN